MDENASQDKASVLTDKVYLGEWQVHLSSHRLTRKDEIRKLEPRMMATLSCLLRNQGRVVTRMQLESEIWPNAVVGYDTLSNTVSRLRKLLGDSDASARIIETIPKVGYRLISTEPVVPPDKYFIASLPDKSLNRILRSSSFLLIVLLLLVFGVTNNLQLSDLLTFNDRTPLAVNEPSLAVFPFVNLGTDPEQDYLSSGLSADLTSSLSKISGLKVVSRYSAFAHRDESTSLQKIASQLGVQYVLQGTIRKDEDRIRVNVNLIDTKSERYLWAETYDDTLNDIFVFQNRLRHRITQALSVVLTLDEQIAITHAETFSAQAYEAFLKGWENFKRRSPEGFVKARDYLTRAVQIDPQYSRANAALAALYWETRSQGWGLSLQIDPYKLRRVSVELISRPDVESTDIRLMTLAKMRLQLGEYQAAINAAEHAYDLTSGDVESSITLAEILLLAGETHRALQVINRVKAQSLSPAPYISYLQGLAAFHRGEHDDAVKFLQASLHLLPHYPRPKMVLAAAYAYLDQPLPATKLRHQIVEDLPYDKARIDNVILQFFPYQHETHKAYLAEGLRRAGMKI